MLVGFLVLELGEILGHNAETARIDADHVHAGLAFDHPFGELPATATGSRDTKTVTFREPEVGQTKCRPDHRIAVWRVGDRTVDDLLDARVLE